MILSSGIRKAGKESVSGGPVVLPAPVSTSAQVMYLRAKLESVGKRFAISVEGDATLTSLAVSSHILRPAEFDSNGGAMSPGAYG